MKKAKNVDAYIEMAPKELQGKLKEMRTAIIETAPNALEKISYGMPYYGYMGRLAYFALAKKHVGLYIPPPIIRDHKKDLEKYETTISAIRFPLDQKLPIPLIKKLVRARMKWNESKSAVKK